MSDWDPSLVDPTDAPRDVAFTRSIGGRSGPLALENGAELSFPWARQQQIAGTRPGDIYVADNPTNEFLLLRSPTLVAGGFRSEVLLVGWTDGTSSVVARNGEGVAFNIASGLLYTSTHLLIANGGTATIDPNVPNGSTLPATLGTPNNHALKVGSNTNDAGHYHLGMDGRYIQAYTGTGAVASDLNLNPAGGAVTIGGVDMVAPLGAWTAYTPTVTQGGTVAMTVTHSRYVKVGRTVTFTFLLSSTAAGAAATLTVSLPAAAAAAGNRDVGGGHIYNGASNVLGAWSLNTTTTIAMTISGGFYGTALAAGHAITGTVTYESAT